MSKWDLPMGWQDVSAYENQQVQFTTLREKKNKNDNTENIFFKIQYSFMIKKHSTYKK